MLNCQRKLLHIFWIIVKNSFSYDLVKASSTNINFALNGVIIESDEEYALQRRISYYRSHCVESISLDEDTGDLGYVTLQRRDEIYTSKFDPLLTLDNDYWVVAMIILDHSGYCPTTWAGYAAIIIEIVDNGIYKE